ncbi:hypothetical protein BST14_26820 [Mycobacterium arosiense ATCC BAA-1401 = DSM 45069]|uniref:Secreted protein n=1 Tax=Mycobacterium arosiense ATCC BAA-1401 = DSM 45069 TaxID=1265311 RepID=A0A1W9Z5Y2_MYCAI|nr:hypothetical protein BST14_26820 [Mycobacterium arosiense ATCC BAA-1401 = DSM 45069]
MRAFRPDQTGNCPRSAQCRAHFLHRGLQVAASAIGLLLAAVPWAHADPPIDPLQPFPDMRRIAAWYTEANPQDFFLPDRPGVWFLTPTGLTCAIWTWGSFGCTGDIPGAPPGDDHIAWFNGNRAVHHGWTAAIQFPAGQANKPLPVRSYVRYESTSCAIITDGNTYCEHGEFKLLLTPGGTYFKGWDDRRSYACLSYGSC